jgi:hypothetical protein
MTLLARASALVFNFRVRSLPVPGFPGCINSGDLSLKFAEVH